jgi:hypothetical protein
MKKLNEKLSEIFDVEPINLEENNVASELVVSETSNPVETDAEIARQNIKELLNKGGRAIDELAIVARDSQHPRAYEVMAGMLKNLADMNKDLLEIQKKKQDLIGVKADSKDVNIDKAIFVGSTTELMKLIKKG